MPEFCRKCTHFFDFLQILGIIGIELGRMEQYGIEWDQWGDMADGKVGVFRYLGFCFRFFRHFLLILCFVAGRRRFYSIEIFGFAGSFSPFFACKACLKYILCYVPEVRYRGAAQCRQVHSL